MRHIELMMLAIGYTVVGVFVFTAFVTCLSLTGMVKLVDRKQQQKLFRILIVEIVVLSVAIATRLFNPNIGAVGHDLAVRERTAVAAQNSTASASGNVVLPSLIYDAISRGDIERVRSLFDNGARVDAIIDPDSNLPLHVAADKCQPEIARFLVNAGASLSATNKFGDTPFTIAESKCDVKSGLTTLLETARR